MRHFFFLRKNIWQTFLFLPNSIKIGREQKDFPARFSDKTETVFLKTFNFLALKLSAVPLNYSLYEILQSPCGSSREEVKHVLLSKCNADISAHLASMESGNSAFVANSTRGNDHLPEAQTLTRKILAKCKIVPIPWPYWESYKCDGQPRHNLPNS